MGGKKNKSEWLRRKRSTERKPTILIVCEGAKTEPNYFNGLRKYRKLSAVNVVIVPGSVSGTNPKSIVEFAKNRKDERGVYFNAVWCVFDRDQHEKFKEAIIQAQDNDIKVAISNPCFELWYLLHFQDQSSHIERGDCIRKLKSLKAIPDYQKSMAGLYNRLLDKQKTAITRAENLRKTHKRDGEDETKNPSTKVDILVKYLNSLKGA